MNNVMSFIWKYDKMKEQVVSFSTNKKAKSCSVYRFNSEIKIAQFTDSSEARKVAQCPDSSQTRKLSQFTDSSKK